MRKVAIALAVLVVLATGGYVGLQAYSRIEAERQVRAAFDALNANGITASHGEVHFDLLSRMLEVADISLASPAGSTKIGRVIASGLGQPAPDRLSAEKIELTGLEVGTPPSGPRQVGLTYGAPALTIEGYEGPLRVSGSDPRTALRGAFAAVSAKRIAIPAFTLTGRAVAQPDTVLLDGRYKDTVIETLKDGIASLASSASSEVSSTPPADAKEKPFSLTFGSSRMERADLATAVFGVAPTGPTGSDGYQTIYASISAADGVFRFGDGMTATIGSLESTGVDARPDAGIASRFEAISAKIGNQSGAPLDIDLADAADITYVLADALDTFRLTSLKFSKVSFRKEGGPEAFDLAAVSIGPYRNGRLDSFSLDGVAGMDADGRPFKLGRFALTGMRPADLFRLGGAAIGASPSEQLALRLAGLKTLEGIAIDGFEGSAGPAPEDAIKLTTFGLNWGAFVGALPTKVALKLDMEGPIGLASGEVFALMEENGAARAAISIDFGANWSEADGTLTLAPFATRIPQAYASSGTIVVGGLTRDALAAEPDKLLAAALDAMLNRVEFRLTDEGLYEMKLKQVAEEQGAPIDAVRDLVAGLAEIMTQEIVEGRPDLEPAAKAVLAFLAEPKSTIALKITPRRPLPLIEAMEVLQSEPAALVEDLDIEATVTK